MTRQPLDEQSTAYLIYRWSLATRDQCDALLSAATAEAEFPEAESGTDAHGEVVERLLRAGHFLLIAGRQLQKVFQNGQVPDGIDRLPDDVQKVLPILRNAVEHWEKEPTFLDPDGRRGTSAQELHKLHPGREPFGIKTTITNGVVKDVWLGGTVAVSGLQKAVAKTAAQAATFGQRTAEATTSWRLTPTAPPSRSAASGTTSADRQGVGVGL